VRLFLGFPITDDIIKECLSLQEELKKTGVKMKLVERENLHITLKFLGEVPESRIDKLVNILELVDERPFECHTTSVGAFPNKNYVRVIWLGVESESILSIHDFIDAELAEIGFQRDKNYVPHITLARVKERPNSALSSMIGKKIEREFKIDKILLMKSKLTREGPVYEIVHEKLL